MNLMLKLKLLISIIDEKFENVTLLLVFYMVAVKYFGRSLEYNFGLYFRL